MSRSKRIGTAFESQVVSYLTDAGIPCRRVALAGKEDEGDIRSDDGSFIIECKAGKAAESASHAQIEAWLVETENERIHAGAEYGFLVLKTAGKGVAQAGLWRVIVPARELNTRWGASVPLGGFVTIHLGMFVDWWRTVRPVSI